MKKLLKSYIIIAFGVLVAWPSWMAPVFAGTGLQDSTTILDKTRKAVTNIDTGQLRDILKRDPRTLLVDVRTNREVLQMGGTIGVGNNVVIPRGWLELRIGEWALKKDMPIIVYSGENRRSPLAARTLMDMGYTNVKNYADGAQHWLKAGAPVRSFDRAQDSFLYRKPEKVTEGVYTATGATEPQTRDNSNHNNNLTFIITGEGVVVFNAGGSYLVARALHDEIKRLTDKPVKYVVLENGQGHAMLGSGYWQERGAIVVAHELTAKKMVASGPRALEYLKQVQGEKAYRTRLVTPDKTFADKLVIRLGGQSFELLYLGEAHEPDDIAMWMPEKKILFMGDLGFHQRLLPIMEDTNVANWIAIWDKLDTYKAAHIIPGHGEPVTDMGDVRKYTRGYLVYMRKQVGKVIEDGGEMTEAYKIDQSAYAHLGTFQQLAAQNIARLYQAMEFE